MAEERDQLKTFNDTMLNSTSDDDFISLSENELDDILIDVDLNSEDNSFDTDNFLIDDAAQAADIESATEGTLDIDDIDLSEDIMIDGAETDIPLDSEMDSGMVNIDDFTIGDVIPEDEVIETANDDMITADDLSSDDMISIDDLSAEIDGFNIDEENSEQAVELEEVGGFEESMDDFDENIDITPEAGYFESADVDEDTIALSEDELDGILSSSEVEYTDDSLSGDLQPENVMDDYSAFESSVSYSAADSLSAAQDEEIIMLDGKELNRRLGETGYQEQDDISVSSNNLSEFTIGASAPSEDDFVEELVEEDVFSEDITLDDSQMQELTMELPEESSDLAVETDDFNIDLMEPEETLTEVSEEEILSIDDLDNDSFYDTMDIPVETAASSIESDTVESLDDIALEDDMVEEIEGIDIIEEIPEENFALSASEETLDTLIQEEVEMGNGDLDVPMLEDNLTGETLSIDDIESEFSASGISLDVPEEDTIASLDHEDGLTIEEYLPEDELESHAEKGISDEETAAEETIDFDLSLHDEIELNVEDTEGQVFDEQLDENIEREILLDDFASEEEPQVIDITVSDEFADDYKTEIQSEMDSAAEVVSLDLEETGQPAEDYDFDYKPEEPAISLEPEVVEDVISEELVETISVDAEIPSQPEIPVKTAEKPAAEGMASISKGDLKEMLLYIDNLFGDLPEEKIKEFAKSKYYDLYNKVFDDLGI